MKRRRSSHGSAAMSRSRGRHWGNRRKYGSTTNGSGGKRGAGVAALIHGPSSSGRRIVITLPPVPLLVSPVARSSTRASLPGQPGAAGDDPGATEPPQPDALHPAG